MRATSQSGALNSIPNAYLTIPNFGTITLNNIPELSETKSARYDGTPIIGRSSPMHTYHFSDTRTVSIQFHFFILQPGDATTNLGYKRAIESCLYPRTTSGGLAFMPPPICQLRVGDLLAQGQDLCVSLEQCSPKYASDVAWDEQTLCPYRLDIDTTWMVVYSSSDLPDQSRIIQFGR